jgi:hypothetical protein
MLKMSAVDVFHSAINSPATDYEYTKKLKRYEKFFKILDYHVKNANHGVSMN